MCKCVFYFLTSTCITRAQQRPLAQEHFVSEQRKKALNPASYLHRIDRVDVVGPLYKWLRLMRGAKMALPWLCQHKNYNIGDSFSEPIQDDDDWVPTMWCIILQKGEPAEKSRDFTLHNLPKAAGKCPPGVVVFIGKQSLWPYIWRMWEEETAVAGFLFPLLLMLDNHMGGIPGKWLMTAKSHCKFQSAKIETKWLRRLPNRWAFYEYW